MVERGQVRFQQPGNVEPISCIEGLDTLFTVMLKRASCTAPLCRTAAVHRSKWALPPLAVARPRNSALQRADWTSEGHYSDSEPIARLYLLFTGLRRCLSPSPGRHANILLIEARGR